MMVWTTQGVEDGNPQRLRCSLLEHCLRRLWVVLDFLPYGFWVACRNEQYEVDGVSNNPDKHLYLQRNSCHPSHCKKSITYSQTIRLRRICSEEDDFSKRTADLKSYLLQREYKQEEIDESIQKASGRRREDCL